MRVKCCGKLVGDHPSHFEEDAGVLRGSKTHRAGGGAKLLGGDGEVGETEFEEASIEIAVGVSKREFHFAWELECGEEGPLLFCVP